MNDCESCFRRKAESLVNGKKLCRHCAKAERLRAEQLRSAAPDLYAALGLAQQALAAVVRALPSGEALADYCSVLDEAERADLAATAALAKARGESQ